MKPIEKIIHYDNDVKQLVLKNHKSGKIRVFDMKVVKYRKF